jgi:DNA-binding transcriptional LysR family regulator
LVLDAVATTGGVSAAAGRLILVLSGISQHLTALEREPGVSIIDRLREECPGLLASPRRVVRTAPILGDC